MVSEEIDIDEIVDEEFINLTTAESYSAVPPRKDASNVSKKVSSADHCESFYSNDSCNGHLSSSFLFRGTLFSFSSILQTVSSVTGF